MQIKGLDEHQIECFLKAGQAVAHALKLAYQITRPGTNMYALATLLEQDILDHGADGWAFPANISLDHYAAHYSPIIKDPQTLPSMGLLKIDLGAHVEGYVADAAITINLGNDDGILSNLVSAVKNALYAAIRVAKPGVRVRKIGAAIQSEIMKFPDLRPVSNLGGHRIGQWILHGAPFIPNVANSSEDYVLKEGDQIAIEPFATNGYGSVKNGKDITIFEVKHIHKKKNLPQLTRIELQRFKEKFKSFPFSPRWVDFIPEEKINKTIMKYYRMGIFDGYNVFEERGEGMVAQHEHSFLISKEGAIPTTWWEDFDYHDLWS